MIVYQCGDSLEGIFTAIYRAYEEKRNHEDTRISLDGELYLFAEYVPVETDTEKACRVGNTLKRRFGEEDYRQVCLALSSRDTEKAQAVYAAVVHGLNKNSGKGHLFDNLADPWIYKAFSLARSAGNEAHHLEGFVRFREVEGGVLFSRIGPKNNVLAFLMPHFADRFPMENFMIYDENRGVSGIHPAGQEWYLVHGEVRPEAGEWSFSDNEKEYQELFRHFCHTIAIRERENVKLQRSMLPLRFQEYMTEFE